MDVDSETDKKNPTWNIGLTGELVTAVFGAAQWEKAHPSVRSMTDRPEFCRYHYHEALDMMNAYIESKLKETGLWGVYEDYDEFSYLMLKIRANITAFVQSLHAVADTCSHMLYYSLALDRLPIPLKERNIYANKVLKLLEQQCDDGYPEYDKLCKLFREITTADDYKYLNALTNTSKHRSIVRSELNEDATGRREEKWILFLEPFWYAGEFFEKTNAREFMRKEHDRIQHLTVNIGVELNDVLKKLQP
ncbi:hypothetical protein IFT37_17715 [Pseudomonas fluorescens]|uniref:hypothetical protein n=1 Tax=Pseudomonas fluorescens TaxID=294 RepID=UPI00178694CA|nr:hypothetical protein [Pseudomonas fluorescens]MBD8147776.1 hypothetical protein [Pseudomonas fluorescens]MBD8177310.1 hypothetical protein [Pseudomonas fluorescens]MBD8746951.1 hypothetical protein [Pseudomonas fluorescens]MBD8753430.1 hypothetical protein [Pseudomonas fluorescens]MBD8759753.1 hypothetical protein [Pseudomonas fluorescens]